MDYAAMLQLSRQFRAALLRRERDAAEQMVIYYQDAYQSMLDRMQMLLKQIAQAQASGTPVTVSWLYEQQRLQALLVEIADIISRFAAYAYGLTRQAEQDALLAGIAQSQALLRTALPGISLRWVVVPEFQLVHLVGNLQDGSPLKALFDSLATDGAKRAGKVLFNGVAAGHGPRVIARQLRDQLSIPLHRALRISRTETMRVYRQAALENYRANGDVVEQWEWSAADDHRTCPICASQNGKRFPLTTEFSSHPNCRCAPIPVTVSYDDILARIA